MTVAITRRELSAGELRREARRCRDAPASRRMLALALVLEGSSREEAARHAGMDRQTLRDRVHRYNAGGLAGLRDRPRSGREPRLTPEQGAELAAVVERGPDPDRDGVVRWRRIDLKALVLRGPDLERDGCVAWRARDLCALVEERFGVRYGESGMLKLLKGLDLSWQKTRPVHPEADPKAQERFKKPCPA